METKDYIQFQFDFLHAALLKITDGLEHGMLTSPFRKGR